MQQNHRLERAEQRGHVRLEQPEDKPCIEDMYRCAFGPGRFARTAYRLRENKQYALALSCVIEHEGQVAGSIRFSEITIGEKAGALLLGPMVVAKAFRGYHYGMSLMNCGIERARQKGYKLVVLVGDLTYYQKADFVRIAEGHIRLPSPYNPHRLLAFELEPGALKAFHGLIKAV